MKEFIWYQLCILIVVITREAFAAICSNTDPECPPTLHKCINGGRCCMQGGVAVCDCSELVYSGEYCHVLSCADQENKCLNGGTCEHLNGNAFCKCPSAFVGPKCEKPCSDICFNNGICEQYSDEVYCSCAENGAGSRYHGQFCQYNACQSNPCLNGGTCFGSWSNTTSCRCPPEFTGVNCADPSPCKDNPCKNGATCYLASNYAWGYRCYSRSPSRFYGQNHSEPSPCYTNLETCEAWETCYTYYPDKVKCYRQCSGGYSCSKCQWHPSMEETNPCLNDGQYRPYCRYNDDTIVHRCICKSGTFGAKCEIKDPCRSLLEPRCHSGGTCIPSADNSSYTCACLPGFDGANCEDVGSKLCLVNMDPFITSFDQSNYEVYGTCALTAVKPGVGDWPSDVPAFQVSIESRKCGLSGIDSISGSGDACVFRVSLELWSHVYVLEMRCDRIEVTIDGGMINREVLPYVETNGDIANRTLFIQAAPDAPNELVCIYTNFGLVSCLGMFNNFEIRLASRLSSKLKGLTAGLCGNNDNDPVDEGMNALIFSSAHMLRPAQPKRCVVDYDGNLPQQNRKKRQSSPVGPSVTIKPANCSEENFQFALSSCEIIKNETGPMSVCSTLEAIDQLLGRCVKDICNDRRRKCSSLNGLARICGRKGVLGNWRSVVGCPKMCPGNMDYARSINLDCIATCSNPNPCGEETEMNNQGGLDGCVCINGEIWDEMAGTCVEPEMCGQLAPSLPEAMKYQCYAAARSGDSRPEVVSCMPNYRQEIKDETTDDGQVGGCSHLASSYPEGAERIERCSRLCTCVKREDHGFKWQCGGLDTKDRKTCLAENPILKQEILETLEDSCKELSFVKKIKTSNTKNKKLKMKNKKKALQKKQAKKEKQLAAKAKAIAKKQRKKVAKVKKMLERKAKQLVKKSRKKSN